MIVVDLPKITLPPSPKKALTAEDQQRAIEEWTRQAERTIRDFEKTVRSLELAITSVSDSVALLKTSSGSGGGTGPAGPQGIQGPSGSQGIQGPAGSGLTQNVFYPGTFLSNVAGYIELIHGLGALPKLVKPVLVCTTAENSYAVNQEVDAFSLIGNTSSGAEFLQAAACWWTTSVVGMEWSSPAASLYYIKVYKSPGNIATLNPANWAPKIYYFS